MLRLTIVFTALIFVSFFSQASAEENHYSQFWREDQTVFSNDRIKLSLNSLVSHTFNKNWGAFGFLGVNKEYAHAYFGPTFSMDDWLQCGIGIGIEQDKRPLHGGTFVFLNDDQATLLVVGEYGGSGYWYKTELMVKTGTWFSPGIMIQRFMGIGLRMQINIPETPIEIWGGPFYDWEEDGAAAFKGLLGVRLNF